jgi:hypothetical protein
MVSDDVDKEVEVSEGPRFFERLEFWLWKGLWFRVW